MEINFFTELSMNQSFFINITNRMLKLSNKYNMGKVFIITTFEGKKLTLSIFKIDIFST